jgi:uncharacterized protein
VALATAPVNGLGRADLAIVDKQTEVCLHGGRVERQEDAVALPTATDPRPRVVAGSDGRHRIAGVACPVCGATAAYAWPRCPACGGAVEAAEFGPGGVVWSATVVRIPVPGRTPPYALAYVDLDDGPRVLVHVDGSEVLRIGGRVRLIASTDDGDARVEEIA